MKIMMLLISYDFPPDIRVEKEAKALIAAGHQLTVVCENRKDRPRKESYQGIDIIRLRAQPMWWRKVNTMTLFLTHRNLLWESQISRIAEDVQPDAIHVHDLPFVGPALRLAHRLGIPLVADLHENYPAYLAGRLKRNWIDRIAFNAERFRRYERKILPLCDKIVVVVEEAEERLHQQGLPTEHITIVSNTEELHNNRSVQEKVELRPSEMTILYVGGLQAIRGLQTVIAALPQILTQIESTQFVIVGDGIYRSRLEELTQELGLTNPVQFMGHQPFDQVHAYIAAADICVVPHIADELVNTTIPHKLFQYMYMKKAVVVSSAKPLARIVDTYNAGCVFESENPDSFAHCIMQLSNRLTREEKGLNGYKAVVEKYNWSVDGEKLVHLYQDLEARNGIVAR